MATKKIEPTTKSPMKKSNDKSRGLTKPLPVKVPAKKSKETMGASVSENYKSQFAGSDFLRQAQGQKL